MPKLSIKESLKEALKNSLPGHAAQIKMAPKPANQDDHPISYPVVNDGAKVNSVMLLLTGNSLQNLELVMTLRSSFLPTHAGQLSLPGGRIEPGESEVEAALRETEEEIGINKSVPEVIGTLTPLYIPHSNNHIRSVVSFMNERKPFTLQPSEVDEAFYVPVVKLLNPDSIKYNSWMLRKNELLVPCWEVHKTPLWGATAMILSEFIEIVRDL